MSVLTSQKFRKKAISKLPYLQELLNEILYILNKNISLHTHAVHKELIVLLPEGEPENPLLGDVRSEHINLLIRYLEFEGFKMTTIDHVERYTFTVSIAL